MPYTPFCLPFVARNPRYDELVDLVTKIKRDVSYLPSGPDRSRLSAKVAPIDIQISQMGGKCNWGSWVRKPDWETAPAFFDRVYKATVIELREIERDLARISAAPTVARPSPVQPDLEKVILPSGKTQIPSPDNFNPFPNKLDDKPDSTVLYAALGIGIVAVAGFAYLFMQRRTGA